MCLELFWLFTLGLKSASFTLKIHHMPIDQLSLRSRPREPWRGKQKSWLPVLAQLCDHEQIPLPLWAPFSTSVNTETTALPGCVKSDEIMLTEFPNTLNGRRQRKVTSTRHLPLLPQGHKRHFIKPRNGWASTFQPEISGLQFQSC